ncbi:MAG: transcription termination factor NusA [Clostridia bacterium]
MNGKEFKKALDNICEERKLDVSVIIEAMQNALSIAYKKESGIEANIRTTINAETGEIIVCKVVTVVDEDSFENEDTEIELSDAILLDKNYKVGDEIIETVTPKDFGRVAVGVAKQVVLQKIREAERINILEEFKDKESELLIGFLAMEDDRNYYVDLGKARGILPKTEIIPGEVLAMGSSLKVYITKIESNPKGPVILLSRKHYGFVKKLFELEIPEFKDGILLIHGVVREPGVRSKVCVSSNDRNVDPIGSCIGEKGRRIASIISELHGEKIDLVLFSENKEEFIANALSPAKDLNVSITNEKNREALVIADGDNLSLAIGKKGINIKLASRLTKYKISIKSLADLNGSKDVQPINNIEIKGFVQNEEDEIKDEN